MKKIVLCLIILGPIYAGCGSSTLSGGGDGQGNESKSVWDDGESHKDDKKKRKSTTVSVVSPFTHGMDQHTQDLSKKLFAAREKRTCLEEVADESGQRKDVEAVFEGKKASNDLRFRDYTDVEGLTLTYGMAESRGISGIEAQKLVSDKGRSLESAFPHRVSD